MDIVVNADTFTSLGSVLPAGDVVVEKAITIEMAHRLQYHEGKCRNIHGHSWSIKIAVSGKPTEDIHSPKDGMVADFYILKRALTCIEELFDHSITLASSDPLADVLYQQGGFVVAQQTQWWGTTLVNDFGRINLIPPTPTSENLVRLWGQMLAHNLPGLEIAYVSVKETASSEATWIPNK